MNTMTEFMFGDLSTFLFTVFMLFLVFIAFYGITNAGNQHAIPEPTPKKHKKKTDYQHQTSVKYVQQMSRPQLLTGIRLDIISQITRLEAALPRLQQEPDFWEEFIAIFPIIKEDIQLHKERLTEKRPIVVVGETSAGKSSFLNRMLGVPLLPTEHQHATAGLIKIQKSEKLAVRPKGGEQRLPVNPNMNQKEAAAFVKNALKDMVTSKCAGANTTEEVDYSEVEVDWPFENELLKEDVTIVDTPGYGQSEAINNTLCQYLNKAVAFLYIINAGNAGGIQEDRIKRIIRAQQEYCNRHKLEAMAPERVLFIFNKWDQIESTEDDESTDTGAIHQVQQCVWDTNIEKLTTVWSEFKPTQAMKFSVKKAKQPQLQCIGVDSDQEKIAKSQCVRIVEDSLKNGLDPTKKWLKRVNGCIANTIETHLQFANTTKSKRDQMRKSCNDKTVDVNVTTQRMKKDIKDKIRKEAGILAKSVRSHINMYNVKEEMKKWKYEQFPCSLVLETNEDIKKKAGSIVLQKLIGIITKDMKTETQQVSNTLASYITSETEKLIKLLKELDDIMNIQVSDVSVVQKNLKTYDHMAIDWFASNLIGADWILGVFGTDDFSFEFVLSLPFRFLASLLKTFSSPHVVILTQASEEVIKRMDEDTIYKALLKALEGLDTEVDELFDKEVARNLDYLNKKFASICESTEKPEQTIARYRRLKDTLDSYLCECQRIL